MYKNVNNKYIKKHSIEVQIPNKTIAEVDNLDSPVLLNRKKSKVSYIVMPSDSLSLIASIDSAISNKTP